MSRRARAFLVGAAALLGVGLLLPAAGDWLVTREGLRVETDGPWRVEDRLIVFRTKDGTLSSVRRSTIDLEASERLTREMAERAARPAPEPRPERREATIRLTERDLPPVARGGEAGEARTGEAQAGEAGGAAEEAAESLQITSWEEVDGDAADGTAFLGEVRNVTERTALGVQVEVTLYDETGESIARTQAALTTTALPARASARFRASFPAVFHYTRVDFRTTGTLVESSSTPASPAPAEEAVEEPAEEGAAASRPGFQR